MTAHAPECICTDCMPAKVCDWCTLELGRLPAVKVGERWMHEPCREALIRFGRTLVPEGQQPADNAQDGRACSVCQRPAWNRSDCCRPCFKATTNAWQLRDV